MRMVPSFYRAPTAPRTYRKQQRTSAICSSSHSTAVFRRQHQQHCVSRQPVETGSLPTWCGNSGSPSVPAVCRHTGAISSVKGLPLTSQPLYLNIQMAPDVQVRSARKGLRRTAVVIKHACVARNTYLRTCIQREREKEREREASTAPSALLGASGAVVASS